MEYKLISGVKNQFEDLLNQYTFENEWYIYMTYSNTVEGVIIFSALLYRSVLSKKM